jgi:hypothetical protein
MMAAVGAPEVISQLESAAKVLMVRNIIFFLLKFFGMCLVLGFIEGYVTASDLSGTVFYRKGY